MVCLGSCTKVFRNFDFFQTSKLLRYNKDAEYKSVTGGITSITVVIILCILFFNMGLRTIRKETVTSSTSTTNEIDPSEMTLTMGPGGNTMIGIFSREVNFSEVPKLFDVTITQKYFEYSSFLNSSAILLEQCTQEHFAFNQ